MKPAGPFLRTTGLDQNWHVFAPDPRQTSLRLGARVRYKDGRVATWRPPAGGDVAGGYWDYRWRKWLENMIVAAARKALWKPAALFAADELREPGRDPAAVALIRRWQDLRPPGATPDTEPWRSYAFYTLSLR